ncbi:MAG: hypothetical protein QXJ06_04805, partial [Candidatus Aenigmatarchaeota archaeon]
MALGYSEKIEKIFKKMKIDAGSKIKLIKGKEEYEGLIMPRIEGNKDIIVVKLQNGYNIGIKYDNNTKIEKIDDGKLLDKKDKIELKFDEKKPTIFILHTG